MKFISIETSINKKSNKLDWCSNPLALAVAPENMHLNSAGTSLVLQLLAAT